MSYKKKTVFFIILSFLSFIVYSKITEDKTWYYNFAKLNRQSISSWADSYQPQKCVHDKFLNEKFSRQYALGSEFALIIFYFSYVDNNIIEYDKNNATTVEFSYSHGDVLLFTYYHRSGDYQVMVRKEYNVRKKSDIFYVRYFQLSNNPVYLKKFPFYRLDETEIPPDQVPEKLKNIDYKTKIDEIDKLLEERWNKACNPKP